MLLEGLVRVPHAIAVQMQSTRLLQCLNDIFCLHFGDCFGGRLAIGNLFCCDSHDCRWRLDSVHVVQIVVVLQRLCISALEPADYDAGVLPCHIHLHAARLDIPARSIPLACASLLVAVVAPDTAVELFSVLVPASIALYPEVVNVRPQDIPIRERERDFFAELE